MVLLCLPLRIWLARVVDERKQPIDTRRPRIGPSVVINSRHHHKQRIAIRVVGVSEDVNAELLERFVWDDDIVFEDEVAPFAFPVRGRQTSDQVVVQRVGDFVGNAAEEETASTLWSVNHLE